MKGRGIAYVNVSIACICILLMSAAFGQLMTRLYRVWGSQWYHMCPIAHGQYNARGTHDTRPQITDTDGKPGLQVKAPEATGGNLCASAQPAGGLLEVTANGVQTTSAT